MTLPDHTGVHHPEHYGGEDNPYEVIKVLQQWLTTEEFIGFCKGNSLKYLARHRRKGGDQDLLKAEWYLTHMLDWQGRGK